MFFTEVYYISVGQTSLLQVQCEPNVPFFHDKLGKVFVYSAVSFRQFPLTFLRSEISGWVLHLSVALVQPSPRDERCDEQIVIVLTFCGTVNIAARARIRSTSFFTSWNCQRDLCHVISLLHDSSGTISMD